MSPTYRRCALSFVHYIFHTHVRRRVRDERQESGTPILEQIARKLLLKSKFRVHRTSNSDIYRVLPFRMHNPWEHKCWDPILNIHFLPCAKT
jgi:hypothetical protein